MLAMVPSQALVVIGILFVFGITVGIVIDLVSHNRRAPGWLPRNTRAGPFRMLRPGTDLRSMERVLCSSRHACRGIDPVPGRRRPRPTGSFGMGLEYQCHPGFIIGYRAVYHSHRPGPFSRGAPLAPRIPKTRHPYPPVDAGCACRHAPPDGCSPTGDRDTEGEMGCSARCVPGRPDP